MKTFSSVDAMTSLEPSSWENFSAGNLTIPTILYVKLEVLYFKTAKKLLTVIDAEKFVD